jgi:hypothetical protein
MATGAFLLTQQLRELGDIGGDAPPLIAGEGGARHTSGQTFHAILMRETVPSEHFHLLMQVG